MEKFYHSLRVAEAVGATVSWAQQKKDGANHSPFAALCFPDSKKGTLYCSVDRESFPFVGWRIPASNSRPSDNFLHHSQAALTTRLRHLSMRSKGGGGGKK